VSYVHVNHVLSHSKTTGMARLLLLIIADRTNKQTGCAFPSYECLARDMNTDMRSFRRALKEIPAGELEITPGGSEKGQKRRPTQYRIVINSDAPNIKPTVRNTRMVKNNNNDQDRAQYAHGSNNDDRAHTGTGPCAKEASDRAQYAHLTLANRIKRTKEATRAHTRETVPHTPPPLDPNRKKPFAVATEESIRELQKRHPRLDVHALFPEAQKACAEKYPDGGPMRHAYFENYLDIEEQRLGPPGLIEGQRIKAAVLAEAARDREELAKKEELTAEQKREPFIATLHARFPQINVHGIAERYLAELDGKPWDNGRFNKLVGEAQDAFWKSLRGD
jgi:hypothetical protein